MGAETEKLGGVTRAVFSGMMGVLTNSLLWIWSRAMKFALVLTSLLLGCAFCAPALAFDCKAARSPIEKIICADAGLLALDDPMGKAYGEVRALGDAAAKAALASSQRAWLATRDGCLKQEKVSACLAAQMTRRLAYLTGRPEAGPGAASRLVPLIRWRQAPAKAEQRIEAFAFAAPATSGEKRFNDLVRGFVDDVIADMGGQPERATTVEVMASLPYASARFVSAHLDVYTMAEGAAHPNTSSRNVNVDLARGRELAFADLFDAAAGRRITGLCREQVLKDKTERGMDDADADEVREFDAALAKALPDLSAWSFTADHVSVTFDRYVVGSYAEGPYGCDLPYADLRPLARPGAWPVD